MDADVCTYFFVRKENNNKGEGGGRREKGLHVFMSCIHALLYRRESTCKNVTIYNVYA